MKYRLTIVLDLADRTDEDTLPHPRGWDWHNLLNLGPNDSVEVEE